MRILVCDDSADVIRLVEDWFEDHPDFQLVGHALGMRAAVERSREHQPDVIVTDTMGKVGGATSLAMLHEVAPRAAVVLYTGYQRFQVDPEILELVDGMVTKGIDETDLVAALRALHRG